MPDFTICPHGPCSTVAQRLDDLMRRCREDRHRVTYEDLVQVRHGGDRGAEQPRVNAFIAAAADPSSEVYPLDRGRA